MLDVRSADSRSDTEFPCSRVAVSRSSGANNQRPTAVGAGPIRRTPRDDEFGPTGLHRHRAEVVLQALYGGDPAVTTQPSIRIVATPLFDS